VGEEVQEVKKGGCTTLKPMNRRGAEENQLGEERTHTPIAPWNCP
jgi:hypothetical protein